MIQPFTFPERMHWLEICGWRCENSVGLAWLNFKGFSGFHICFSYEESMGEATVIFDQNDQVTRFKADCLGSISTRSQIESLKLGELSMPCTR